MSPRTPIRLLTMSLLVVALLNLAADAIGWPSVVGLAVGAILGTGLAFLLDRIRAVLLAQDLTPWDVRPAMAPISAVSALPEAASDASRPTVPKKPVMAPAWRTEAFSLAKSFATVLFVVTTTMLLRTVVALEFLQ